MLPLTDNNLLFIDKPKGISSFDVIRALRKIIGKRKMGHAGTLDPLATGLLIIGVDRGTKELARYLGSNKTYEAQILIGIATETEDLEGKVTDSKAVSNLSEKAINEALAAMTGEVTIPAPMYSAIKVDGTPLYKHARAGHDVTPPERTMKVITAELRKLSCQEESVKDISQNFCRVNVKFAVGSGTYIRSLAVELGRRLGYPATLANLRRTQVGEIKIEQAHTLEKISDLVD